jgi:hypothetical protein
MRSALAAGRVVAALLVCLTACFGAEPQFELHLSPRAPVGVAPCTGSVAAHGLNGGDAQDLCRQGAGHPWYHAVLTNNGDTALPSCTIRAFDDDGAVVFEGRLPVYFGPFPYGMITGGGETLEFDWYLDGTSAPVRTYSASCVVDDTPPE